MTASLQPGDTMSFRKTLTVAEQAMYTGISGNLAPLYVDQRAARDAATRSPATGCTTRRSSMR